MRLTADPVNHGIILGSVDFYSTARAQRVQRQHRYSRFQCTVMWAQSPLPKCVHGQDYFAIKEKSKQEAPRKLKPPIYMGRKQKFKEKMLFTSIVQNQLYF
ncbi:hypothetical protein ACFX1X_002445 [Malus domestica]